MPVQPVRVFNPPNPYLSDQRELIGQPPAAELEVYEDRSGNILSQNDSPDVGFRWSVNPYRGCFHSCAYCLSGDTPILLANGRTKSIADILIGDQIYGTVFKGDYRRFVKTEVIAHWMTIKPAYRVSLEDGTELITSADHRFLSNRGWKYVTGTESGRRRRPHLTLRNRLLGIGTTAVSPEESAEYQRGYLCGLIKGDGLLASYDYSGRRRASDIQYQFRLALIDSEPLQRAKRYLLGFEIPTYEFSFQAASVGYQPMHGIRNNARIHIERIDEIIRWPAVYSDDWRKGFLAGIFDAEGSYSRGILRVCNTNPDIIACTVACFKKLGFDCVIENRLLYKTAKPIFVARVRGGLREHWKFFQRMNPAITRKRSFAGQAIKNHAQQVVSVEPLGLSLPMFDITTGTGDFIANGVVSHNCYARPTHEYFGLGAGTDFERKIIVKPNAPQLLEEAFRKKSWKGERVVFSGVTDCYQPLEAAWKLTRGCLEVCLNYRNPAAIISKSILVRRDVDVLQGLNREASVRVSLSIPFLDEEIARKVEPGAPAIRRRFETMELLAKAGIPVAIGIAPIIPGLNDRDIPGLLKRAKECGARFAFKTLLRLPGSVRPVFIHRMREDLPLKAEHILKRIRDVRQGRLSDPRFGYRHHGEGPYWEAIEKSWDVWTERLGFNLPEPEEETEGKSTFRRPGEHPQMEFSWKA